MSTPLAPQFWVDWWAVNPRPDRTAVVWGPNNNNVEECFEQVADGVAACICPASMIAFYRRPDLSWIPIIDVDPLQIALGWHQGTADPIVHAFAEVVREVVDEPRADYGNETGPTVTLPDSADDSRPSSSCSSRSVVSSGSTSRSVRRVSRSR